MTKKTLWRGKMISLTLGFAMIIGFLVGCEEINYTVTDRDYYKTHTGTEQEGPQFKKLELATEEEEEKKEMTEPGIITNCDLRTGVETNVYSDAGAAKLDYTIPANLQFTIKGMENNFFEISYNENDVWIPITDCLVNVKDYIPGILVDLSFAKEKNDFNIGGSAIDGLTTGAIYTREGSVNGEEAWLRYETIEKLYAAWENFDKDGYTIRICEAYCPMGVANDTKELLSAFMLTSAGGELSQTYCAGYEVVSSYDSDMAPHVSGSAVDITLIEKDSENEVEMPTAMHTLDASALLSSWQGSNSEKNSHAQYMLDIMSEAGFTNSNVAWWHFQDDSFTKVMYSIPN